MNDYREFAKCSADIEYFIEKYLKITLNESQKEVLEALTKNNTDPYPVIQNRISGKSTAISCYFAHSLIFKDTFRAAVAAPNKMSSDNIISLVTKMINTLPEPFPIFPFTNSSVGCGNNILYSVGMSHNYMRGIHLDKFVVDESEFVENLRDLMKNILPCLSSKGNYNFISSSKSHDIIREFSIV